MSEFESYLKNFDDDFAAAKTNSFTPLPDGKYQARIESIRIEPNQKSGELALRIEMEIAVGDYDGRKAFYYKPINNKQMDFLKSDLARLGVNPEPFSKIESYFPGLLDKIIEIQVKTSKPNDKGETYSNVYIQKVVGSAPAAPANNKTEFSQPF